ncbi:hypothetical protein T492DRAFT_443963 [Pavlovales sp. CCMP2436]|nr:hypothetical protein T492DRAFT_443963 [Pavlovales sp. CCMP2436]
MWMKVWSSLRYALLCGSQPNPHPSLRRMRGGGERHAGVCCEALTTPTCTPAYVEWGGGRGGPRRGGRERHAGFIVRLPTQSAFKPDASRHTFRVTCRLR